MNCELDELKNAMGMTFGDWQLFRAMVMTLREQELIGGLYSHVITVSGVKI